MGPALSPGQVGQEAAACAVLGACLGAGRAFFPVRGRGALLPDVLLMGGLLLGTQSYAASLSAGGVPRWYMLAAAIAGIALAEHLLGVPLRAVGRVLRWQNTPRPMPRPVPPAKRRPKNAGTKKDLQKNRKRTCQVSGACCIIQTYQSKSTGAKSLLYVRGLTL